MNDQPYIKGTPGPRMNNLTRIRNHPYFKPALIAVAAAAGGFLAVRASLKELTSEVKHIGEHAHNVDQNVYSASAHVIDEIHFQQKLRHNTKEAINVAVENDSGFTFYPGVGVRFDNVEDNVVAMDKARAKTQRAS